MLKAMIYMQHVESYGCSLLSVMRIALSPYILEARAVLVSTQWVLSSLSSSIADICVLILFFFSEETFIQSLRVGLPQSIFFQDATRAHSSNRGVQYGSVGCQW